MSGEELAVRNNRRIGELGRLGKKALLAGNWTRLAELMNENHSVQRDLGGSGESNEKLIAAAMKAGALGAKLAGAGDGGTIIALWPWKDRTALETALLEAGASNIYEPRVVAGVTIEVDEAAPRSSHAGEG